MVASDTPKWDGAHAVFISNARCIKQLSKMIFQTPCSKSALIPFLVESDIKGEWEMHGLGGGGGCYHG